ncbi:nucleoside diphosphate kinase regulator [Marinimicrobium sp. LS-A18]|uniref:nucleoside diphosphate kinase regulator n=1 Tax=Marinimicrobium sp. LS-A18 TaxID=1381596 RepID=UPI0004AF3766|nr:nucleoside diphosphate kinase regulator [Marinimicrobium sp. LS-A18]
MASKPKITLTKNVYERLWNLLESVPEDTITNQLEEELERAKIVTPAKLPDDVVTMHSQVTFTVQSTGKTFTYTLVYPTELDNTENKLSILSPIGSAIIGLKQGQEIDWPISKTQRTTVKVEAVSRAD